MLVLQRKIGESIMIGAEIQITVMAIRGGKTRLGILAPKDIRVVRMEIEPALRGPARIEQPEMVAQGR